MPDKRAILRASSLQIDGILFPLLAIVGALNVLSVISFDWNLFWLAFLVILVASFAPEWVEEVLLTSANDAVVRFLTVAYKTSQGANS